MYRIKHLNVLINSSCDVEASQSRSSVRTDTMNEIAEFALRGVVYTSANSRMVKRPSRLQDTRFRICIEIDNGW